MARMVLLLGIICLIALNCAQNCDDEMDDIKSKKGTPEEVNTYSTSDYKSETWWYWSKGISYTFTWGSSVGKCEVSTYTFSPISANSSKEEKARINDTKILIKKELFPCREILK